MDRWTGTRASKKIQTRRSRRRWVYRWSLYTPFNSSLCLSISIIEVGDIMCPYRHTPYPRMALSQRAKTNLPADLWDELVEILLNPHSSTQEGAKEGTQGTALHLPSSGSLVSRLHVKPCRGDGGRCERPSASVLNKSMPRGGTSAPVAPCP